MTTTSLIKADYHSLIHEIRGYKVMLDFDLAALYGVETKRLKESVRRNIDRFPEDFMFELNKDEFLNIRTQFATSKKGWNQICANGFHRTRSSNAFISFLTLIRPSK